MNKYVINYVFVIWSAATKEEEEEEEEEETLISLTDENVAELYGLVLKTLCKKFWFIAASAYSRCYERIHQWRVDSTELLYQRIYLSRKGLQVRICAWKSRIRPWQKFVNGKFVATKELEDDDPEKTYSETTKWSYDAEPLTGFRSLSQEAAVAFLQQGGIWT